MKGRNHGLDLLKVIAIYSVIIIHLPCVDSVGKNYVLSWLPYANGCFAMLAGWFMYAGLFMGNGLSFGEWLRKRARHLLIPYLIWDCFHILLSSGLAQLHHEYVFPSWALWRDMIFFGIGGVQFWFVISLFYAQVIVVLISRFMLKCSVPMVWCGALFLLSGFVKFYVLPESGLWQLNNVLSIFGFCAAGLGARMLSERFLLGELMSCPKVRFVAVLCSVTWIVLTHFVKPGPLWPIGILAWCVCFGTLADKIRLMAERCRLLDFLTLAGNAVMGVYLCHWFITRMFFKPIIPILVPYIGGGRVCVVSVSFAILVISMAMAILLRKFKWLWG